MKLRFSLASLLLVTLVIGASVLLYDKWPAFTLTKIRPAPEHTTKIERWIWDPIESPNTQQHYFDRLAGIEAGVPEDGMPNVPCTEQSRNFLQKDYSETRMLFYNERNKCYAVYEMGNAVPLVVFEDPFHTDHSDRAGFVWPRQSGMVYVALKISSDFIRYALVDTNTGLVLKKFQALQPKHFTCLLTAGGHWYGCRDEDTGVVVWDFEKERDVPLPLPAPVTPGTTVHYLSWPLEEDSARIRVEVDKDDEPYCYTLWDLDTGKALDWKPGILNTTNIKGTYIRSWKTPDGSAYEIMDEHGTHPLPELKGQQAPLLTFFFSPDRKRLIGSIDGDFGSNKEEKSRTWLWELERDIPPYRLPRESAGWGFSSDSQFILTYDVNTALCCFRINHPDCWYGVIYIYEFWLTLILSILLLLSIRKDFRSLKARA